MNYKYYPTVNIYTTECQHQQIPSQAVLGFPPLPLSNVPVLQKCPQVIGITHSKWNCCKLPPVWQIISSGHLVHCALGHFLQMPRKIPEDVLSRAGSQQAAMPGAVTRLLTASQLSFIQSSPEFVQQSFFL